jgi:hypothetical protein
MSEDYNKKYLKYKEKYLALKKELSQKNMKGGMFPQSALFRSSSSASGASGAFDINNLDKLPYDVIYTSILPSLPIKDVINLGMTNRRFYGICNDYIQRYISAQQFMNKPEDILFLLTHPLYGPQIRPVVISNFSTLDQQTQRGIIEFLRNKAHDLSEVFETAVFRNGGPSSPRQLFQNGGRLYKIEIMGDLEPGYTQVETLISAKFHKSPGGIHDNTPGYFGLIYINGNINSLIAYRGDRDIPLFGELSRKLISRIQQNYSNINIRVVECVYDPHTFGTDQEPRETNVLATLF